jgi:glycosyltransferase involved in cell wall biosynthesis
MRIIQVTPRYYPTLGGVEAVVQRISEMLVERGNEVVVYSVDKHKNLMPIENVNGVIVKRFSALYADPLYLPETSFSSSLRRENADIIHVHNIHTFPPLIAALFKTRNQSLVLQPHYHRYGQTALRHSLFKLYQRVFHGLLFSKSNAVIANSRYEEQILREDFPALKRMVLIPEGVDTSEAESVMHVPVLPKRILFVGSLHRYKNVHRLLEGFAYLIKIRKVNCRLVIVGNGPERESLINLASSLGIAKLVDWKQGLSRADLLNEYAKASVFVMLSPLESFSRVVFDALIIGVSTVVLNYGALCHLVNEGLAEGVDSLNNDSVANALLKASECTYQKLSLTSGSFLDWDSYLDRLTSLYRKL